MVVILVSRSSNRSSSSSSSSSSGGKGTSCCFCVDLRKSNAQTQDSKPQKKAKTKVQKASSGWLEAKV